MKKIVFLLVLLMVNMAFPKCKAGALFYFPEQTEVGVNTLFMILGYGESQQTVRNLKTEKAYLQTENGTLIALMVTETLVGDMKYTQAILKPEKKLQPNTVYYLVFKNKENGNLEDVTRYNSETRARERFYWKTTNQKVAELTNVQLSYEKNEYTAYGCGPGMNAIFNITTTTTNEVWYRTVVTNTKTHKTTTFYLTADDAKLYVGHGMCGGAFTYVQGHTYTVRFTPTSTSGVAMATTKPIQFNSPNTSF